MYLLSFGYEFSAARRIFSPIYKGWAKNIHGHNFKVQITVNRPKLNYTSECPHGMIVNLDSIKRSCYDKLIQYLDGAFIVCKNDAAATSKTQKLMEHPKMFILPEQYPDATLECIAEYIYDYLKDFMTERHNVSLHSVRAYSDENTFAEVLK